MANIKSAIKRNKQNDKKRIRNRIFRGRTRSFISKARSEIEKGNAEESRAAVFTAISSLDKAVQQGIIHKNNGARRKSRLMKRLATLA